MDGLNDNSEAEPFAFIDRMEEVVKLKERRQQRLMQLRELRQGKPPSFWATDASGDVSPNSKGKKIVRPNFSESLPTNAVPTLVQNTLKKNPSSATREGKTRDAKPQKIHRSNLSKSLPANTIPIPPLVQGETNPSAATREGRGRDAKPKKTIRSNLSKSLPVNQNPPLIQCNLKKTPSAAARVEGRSKDKTSAQKHSPQPIRQSVDAPADDTYLSKGPKSMTRHSCAQIVHKKSNSSRSPNNLYKKSKSCGVTATNDRPAPIQKLPSLKNLLHNSGDIDYTQSAEELSQLIAMMQIEFKTLRDAKDQAEATANKLRTEFSQNQQEMESQLLFLSRENERLKTDTIKLHVDMKQVNKSASRAEREKRSLVSRLVKTQNEKIEVETKLGNLELENLALKKAFTNTFANNSGGTVAMLEVGEDILTTGYARIA